MAVMHGGFIPHTPSSPAVGKRQVERDVAMCLALPKTLRGHGLTTHPQTWPVV